MNTDYMHMSLGKTCGLWIALLLIPFISARAQMRMLDAFNSKEGWSFIRSDGVELGLASDQGIDGACIRFDCHLTTGTGYGGIQKLFPVDLPDNYEFTFYLKAESPTNNLEIKFIDSTGNNVWWVINRNYDFPREWKKIRIKKRHISFAWGPAEDHNLKRIDRIEFTVSSAVGGKGTLWIDDLTFEPLPPETDHYPSPFLSAGASQKDHAAGLAMDGSEKTFWQSLPGEKQHLQIDFRGRREFGGLAIRWQPGLAAGKFRVLLSGDGKQWETAYDVPVNRDDVSFIRLPEAEAAFLKLDLLAPQSGNAYGIGEISILPAKSGTTANDFLIWCAKNSPEGNYPRYFSEQASFWTLTGVNNDVKEALINEDGMVEAEKARFSIEPVVMAGQSLLTWNRSQATQSLGLPGSKGDFEFLPAVTRHFENNVDFTTGISAVGEANRNSRLQISYFFNNTSDAATEFDLYLLIRPFQVNPYYQFLNLTGGAGKINTIREENGMIAVDDQVIISGRKYDAFGAHTWDEGNPADFIRAGKMPPSVYATDPNGLAGGILKYTIRLAPREQTRFFVVVPFYGRNSVDPAKCVADAAGDEERSIAFWRDKVSHVRFNLPPTAQKIIDTYRSNLAYILVNRDRVGIQPGSRSYERSWIRDGALTSSALLKSGIVPEVRDFIDWYTSYQFESGKVPCVVDSRGPDPVPENDSHGEMIYLIREYFNFTQDTAFLRSKNPHVLKAVEYIEKLVAEQKTDRYRNGNDSLRSCFGLVTESISHEGYSARPMHSYWDDFFTLKGLKDAAEIQKILGEEENYRRIAKVRDTFKEDLYNSIRLTMERKKIDYIPGCAELGDFDATSTTIALTPCNELINLPKPQVYNTFDRYYSFFRNRRDGTIAWENYTPYENRLIGSFITLDQPDRAHDLIAFFLGDQRPQGWNHWAEVVWRDSRTPRYIGDMPHTWVGSDFINAIRAMFVYENEYDRSLVLGSALYQDWIDVPGGMSVEHLPTYYGEISYFITKDQNRYTFSVRGDLHLPENGIRIRNFNGARIPSKVTVNGKEISGFSGKEIPVTTCPAEVVITY